MRRKDDRFFSANSLLSYLDDKVKNMKLDEKYEPYNLFIRFLLVEMLTKSNKEKALVLLSELDLKEIQNPMHLSTANSLERKLLAEEMAKVVTFEQLRSKL